MVAVASSLGKVMGLDSKTGNVLWRLNYPGGGSVEETKVYVQRGTAHFGFDARCSLVYRNRYSGRPELMTFNPVDGSLVAQPRQLEASFTRAVMIHHVTDVHIK